MRPLAAAAIAVVLAGLAGLTPAPAKAQSGELWVNRQRNEARPYDEPDRERARAPAAVPSVKRSPGGIERGSLPPIGSAAPAPGYGGARPPAGNAGSSYGGYASAPPARSYIDSSDGNNRGMGGYGGAPASPGYGMGGMDGMSSMGGMGGMGGYAAGPAAGGLASPDLWRGLSFDTLRDRLLKVDGNGGSLVLDDLLVQAVLADSPVDGAQDVQMRDLLKMVVLYRMGRIAELTALLQRGGPAAESLPGQVFLARALLAGGDLQRACAAIARFPISDPNVPQELMSEALLTSALCAADRKDLHNAGLMMDLARDRGIKASIAFTVIEYLISGTKPRLQLPDRLGVSDYLFLRLTGAPAPAKVVDMADAALVYLLAHDAALSGALRAEALERAARSGGIAGEELARFYAEIAGKAGGAGAGRSDGETRALLLDAAARGGEAQNRARIIDTLLTNVRKVRLAESFGPLLAPYVRELRPSSELAWFAPRAVEVALLAHDQQLLESWLLFAKEAGREAYAAAEWLPLAQLIQPDLVSLDDGSEMALRMANGRRLEGDLLHLLASVLDAMAVNVPIPLWNEAGKHPQPNRGVLPPSGQLSNLKQARDDGRAGEALLLSLEAVGATAPDELHLLALGDIVRSLHKSGFEREAAWFGFEALYRRWPTGQARIAAR